MKTKKYYIMQALHATCDVQVPGLPDMRQTLSYSDLADGCVGVMLVFGNKKSAKKYAGKTPIIEMEAAQ
jgi:hypothetical protein